MAASVEQGMHGLTVLMQLEAEARKTQTDKALQFLIVNETRRLLPYRQAFLFSSPGDPRSRCRVEVASSIAVIDHNVPLIRWMELAVDAMREKDPPDAPQRLDSSKCPQGLAEEWREFSLPYVLWCPLCRPDGPFLGGLWLAREMGWRDGELTLMKRLGDAYAHAWGMFAGKRRLASKWRSRHLAVADSITLSEGAEVKVFLDVDPLHALQATVTHASYKAEVLPGDLLAYRVHADLKESDSTVRIGLQGTAKIYSEPVAVFLSIPTSDRRHSSVYRLLRWQRLRTI